MMPDKDLKFPIGIVIPGYGHPQFLAEAIISACEQQTERDIHVVVVDDGCKFPETKTTVANLLSAYPGKLHYVRQKNTRLPGARNTGIRFLLNLLPELDAIYFLDADNRISPYSIEAYRDTLGDDPAIGWAYPDISFFGLTHGENGFDTRETAPDYSVLKHLIGNISEAGSMVRADVFRQGVMYDESMIFGYEDWDFWLYALEAGFRGQRCPNSGFLYRRRPESMLADSTRMGQELISRMRRTHKALFNPQHVMALEHDEAPYFAVYLRGDEERIMLFSDPAIAPKIIEFQEFKNRFHSWFNSPREYFMPQLILMMEKETWSAINANVKIVRWLFWQLREASVDKLYLSLKQDNHAGLHIASAAGTASEDAAVMVSSLTRFRDDVMQTAADKPPVPAPVGYGVLGLLQMAEVAAVGRIGLEQIEQEVSHKLSPVPQFVRHQNRTYAGPSQDRIRKDLIREICALEGREPFPACEQIERTLVAVKSSFLLTAATRDRVLDLLQKLKKEHTETILLIEHASGCDLIACKYDRWQHLVDGVIPYQVGDKSGIYKMYLGRGISEELAFSSPEDTALFGRQCTRIIGCGAVAMLEAFGDGRLHGVSGYVMLDRAFAVLDTKNTTQFGKILAYEHAITNIVTDEETYRTALTAEGFPPSKFVETEFFYRDILNLDC